MMRPLPRKISRRAFLSTSVKLAIGTTGILAGSTGLFYYGSVRQDKHRRLAGTARRELPGSIVRLGDLESLNRIEEAERVSYEAEVRDAWVTKPVNGFVYITKNESGKLLVLSSLCTHLGCSILPPSNAQRPPANKLTYFQCPCHGAEFDINGNSVNMGLRGLDTFEPIIAGGHVYIDIANPIRKSS